MLFEKFKKIFLPTKSWKNHAQKLLRKTQIHFFSTASTAQMAQTEEFMSQNLAYRPTVYRTGCTKVFNKKLVTSQRSLKIYPWPVQHVLTSSPNFSFIVSFGNLLWWQTSQDSSSWLCKLQWFCSHSSMSSLS